MYYDYPEEEFYAESEYQEQIDALKEAVRDSVKSGILEEMNRLRAENEKLQGVKEHFEEIKSDYERKKNECNRIVRNAEQNAKRIRLAELMKDHKVVKWRIDCEYVYGPKCNKCDVNRNIEVKLPSGRTINDSCKCNLESKKYYYPQMHILSKFTDIYKGCDITSYYSERKFRDGEGTHYDLYDYEIEDRFSADKKKKAIENLSDEVREILFDDREECQKVCDRLNGDIGNFLYKLNGDSIKECLKMAKGE